MVQKNRTEFHHSVDLDSINARTIDSNQQQETVVFNDTAELTVAHSTETHKPHLKAPQATSPRRKRVDRAPESRVRIAIESEEQTVGADEFDVWDATYRGIPSWLSSLIIHLSIILVLALFTMTESGKSVIDLIGNTSESVELETLDTMEIVLEPDEIQTIDDVDQVSNSKVAENEDFTSLLDDDLLTTEIDSDQGSLFESISDQGLGGAETFGNIGKVGTQFFGIDGTGKDFVFVIDCSGSMADYGRWRLAVRELKRSIRQMTEQQRFLILLYNNGFIAMNDDAELVPSTEREQERALRWLNRNKPDNWTFCAEALAKALTLKPDSIFLLSDGEFDDRQDVYFVLDQLNSKRINVDSGRQIPVNTIALGSHEGRWTMKRIAEQNNGTYKLIE